MGATTYLVPPIAVVLGWAILGETPPALAFAGGLLCLAGVAVTRGARFGIRTGRTAELARAER
jgi:drug/metabolite transporter (DMT)-like permease